MSIILETEEKKKKTKGDVKYTLEELILALFKLINNNIFDDVAVLNVKHIKSIKDFNNVYETMKYINETYCTEIIIKFKGKRSYSGSIKLHQFNGFRLNEKSLVILNKPIFNGKDYIEQPNTYFRWK